MGMYFEELEVGQEFQSRGRTITEADVVNFAGLSGDFNPLHTDEEYAKKTIFGKRIAHGALALAISTGLSQSLGILDGTIMAFLGLEWNFHAPVFIGDTLHLDQVVKSKRETSKPDRGIIVFEARMVNQRDEVVQEGTRTIMVRRKE